MLCFEIFYCVLVICFIGCKVFVIYINIVCKIFLFDMYIDNNIFVGDIKFYFVSDIFYLCMCFLYDGIFEC